MTRKSTTIGIKLAIVALLCTAFFTAKFGNSLRVSASPEDGAPKLNYSSYNDLEDMVSDYHKKMNEIVNEKTELFLSYDHKALQKFDRPPQEIMKKVQNEDGTSKLVPTGNFEACDSKNTSTFCLAELLVREHFAFREGMIARRNIVLSEAQANALEEIGKLDKKYSSAANKKSGEDELEDLQDIEEDEQETISGLVERVGKIDTFIDRELDISRKTLDGTLAAYNELHTAWPLHQKYTELIANLEDYRDAISDVRDEITFYPANFLDATTASCK